MCYSVDKSAGPREVAVMGQVAALYSGRNPEVRLYNGLALNPEKSEAILLGTHPRNKSLDNITQVDVNCSPIPISDNIKLLGATIDSSLAFNKHIDMSVLPVPHPGSSPHSPHP